MAKEGRPPRGQSHLLIDEEPLQVLPSLAVKIGLNEAMVVQQIHYWIHRLNHEHDGRRWVYNSYEGWQSNFPFWSIRTIKRIFSSLESSGVLITGNYNKLRQDRTKWYSINYEKLAELEACDSSSGDDTSGTGMGTNWHDGSGQVDTIHSDNLAQPLPENTQREPIPITSPPAQPAQKAKKPKTSAKSENTEFQRLFDGYLSAIGKKWSDYAMDEVARATELNICKNLHSRGYTKEDVEGCTRWCMTWTSVVPMKLVSGQISAWRLAGKPQSKQPGIQTGPTYQDWTHGDPRGRV